MNASRPIHKDFLSLLELKPGELAELYCDLRNFILELHPQADELLYHTHALTSVYSFSLKLTDAYCMIPIYSNHLNLGFNKGTLLKDPHRLLQGTGKLIRHLPIREQKDYRNAKVTGLVKEAILFAEKDMDKPAMPKGLTISKIS